MLYALSMPSIQAKYKPLLTNVVLLAPVSRLAYLNQPVLRVLVEFEDLYRFTLYGLGIFEMEGEWTNILAALFCGLFGWFCNLNYITNLDYEDYDGL